MFVTDYKGVSIGFLWIKLKKSITLDFPRKLYPEFTQVDCKPSFTKVIV